MSKIEATDEVYVFRKFVCKSPTKTVSGSWRLFWPVYEINVFAIDRAGQPGLGVNYIKTIYATDEDFLILKLTKTVYEYGTLVSEINSRKSGP